MISPSPSPHLNRMERCNAAWFDIWQSRLAQWHRPSRFRETLQPLSTTPAKLLARLEPQCDTGEAWGMTRLALARVRCGSGVSGGGVGGVDLHRVKAVRAVAMLNHEHSVHSPTDVVARRGDYQTHNPRARCQISCAARGCRLPELHGRSCFVPAELSNYQDWRCARCRADEPGSWRSCPPRQSLHV